jgi:hypothetical protein
LLGVAAATREVGRARIELVLCDLAASTCILPAAGDLLDGLPRT